MIALGLLLWLTGCASFHPVSINEVRFRDRMQSTYDDDVRVSVAVPSAEESRAVFGAHMAKKDIQPIWAKVENHSDRTYYLIVAAVDPNYFSPIEAAYAVHGGFSPAAKKEMEHYFRSMTFRNPILPNTAVSGFVFTNLDEGEKVVHVDLIASQQVKSFTFFVQIPGMRVDYRMVDFDSLYRDQKRVDLKPDALRQVLEHLPCCVTDKEGKRLGDPLNLVIIGDFDDVAAAFARRGWLPTEETYSTSVWKTTLSFLLGSPYKHSPISSLYYDGRHQDFARQKPRHSIHERNHLRLWYTSMRFAGKPIFVGQVSRDIGVRFTTKTWPPVTHKIDPDIDEARYALVEDLLFSQMLAKVGFARGVGMAEPSKPRTNLTGDPYFTDGLRVVMVLDSGPISLEEIQSLHWEQPKAFRIDALEVESD